MKPQVIDIEKLRKQLPFQKLRPKGEKKIQIDWKAEWERFDAKKLFDFKLESIPQDKLNAMRARREVILDGNQAALSIFARLVDGLCGYPITPSTPLAENFARAASAGQKNLFANDIMYLQPNDELSAIVAAEAMASQGGRYVDNTSSQGLTLKTKNLFSVAGKRLPIIMTVMAREVNKGSLSIHCGHTDFYGVRNSGWTQLVSGNNQELHELLAIAFKVAELRQVMLPGMVVADGFIKSHALENIRELPDEFLNFFIGQPNRLYQGDFDNNPALSGTFTDTDLTMEGQIAQDFAYRFYRKAVIAAMNMMNQILGTDLKVVENYRTEDADMVIVILGSAAGVVRDIVDYYRHAKGVKVGMVRPVLFTPPCFEELAFGMRSAKVVTVLERSAIVHNQPLKEDVQAALQLALRAGRDTLVYSRSDMPEVLHGVYGLGSKDFNKYDVAAVIENMAICLTEKNKSGQKDFYIGVEGPYTLMPAQLPGYRDREVAMTFIGVGAEGVKTSLETSALIYAEDSGASHKYVQSGARYGAARKGAAVFMNLRISADAIQNSSQTAENDVVAFFNETFLSGQILQEYVGGIKEHGLLVVNTPRSSADLIAALPPAIKHLIEKCSIKVLTVNATQAALKYLKKNLPGAAIVGLINKELGILPEEEFEKRFTSILEKKIGTKKGQEAIGSNIALLRDGIGLANASSALAHGMARMADAEHTEAMKPPAENFGQVSQAAGLPVVFEEKDELGTIKPIHLHDNYKQYFYQEMVKPISEGKKIPWDRFLPIVPAATSQYRDLSYIGTQLPIWHAEKCTACGMCVTQCPDSALYSTITDCTIPEAVKRYFKIYKKPPRGIPWEQFALNINARPDACKGCGACAQVCPTDAITMKAKTDVTPADFIPDSCQELDRTYEAAKFVDRMVLPHQVLFVFSKLYPGKHTLCPGCSEGVINLLTFFAAESLRNNPQGIATLYQGPRILSDKTRRSIEQMLEHGFHICNINSTGCNQVSELANPYNSRIYRAGHYGFGTASAAALGAKFAMDQTFQNQYSDVMTKVIVFAGDGAIYDIGNGPFNYALGENYDITWIIYNNEGYMNTGVQKSGASRFGSDRSTSPMGKKYAGKTTTHRRLISQAMAIPHVYAAKLSLDDPFYAINILKEAIAYNGPAVVEFFSYCPQGHQYHDWAGPLIARMMVESRKWQLVVRRPFQSLDISGNPEPEKIYPTKARPFKKAAKRDPATFGDVVKMLGQYSRHLRAFEGVSIPEIIMVNEMVSMYRWIGNQFMAGFRDSLPEEDELERFVMERYKK
jgi:pyruvate-ferredoxin/flavodoxin oxidoreductase